MGSHFAISRKMGSPSRSLSRAKRRARNDEEGAPQTIISHKIIDAAAVTVYIVVADMNRQTPAQKRLCEMDSYVRAFAGMTKRGENDEKKRE